ncbi:hypothetical protein HDU96_010157 [Phlyctochytrium bullatum]|nr:hypothetical protein HDU96_010157 [Phlyctochytrium bullatum]
MAMSGKPSSLHPIYTPWQTLRQHRPDYSPHPINHSLKRQRSNDDDLPDPQKRRASTKAPILASSSSQTRSSSACKNPAGVPFAYNAADVATILRDKMLTKIGYSERYYDQELEYRHVILPKALYKLVPSWLKLTLLSEPEWRSLGITMSPGWIHYMVHRPEPHIFLFRREKFFQEKYPIVLKENKKAANDKDDEMKRLKENLIKRVSHMKDPFAESDDEENDELDEPAPAQPAKIPTKPIQEKSPGLTDLLKASMAEAPSAEKPRLRREKLQQVPSMISRDSSSGQSSRRPSVEGVPYKPDDADIPPSLRKVSVPPPSPFKIKDLKTLAAFVRANFDKPEMLDRALMTLPAAVDAKAKAVLRVPDLVGKWWTYRDSRGVHFMKTTCYSRGSLPKDMALTRSTVKTMVQAVDQYFGYGECFEPPLSYIPDGVVVACSEIVEPGDKGGEWQNKDPEVHRQLAVRKRLAKLAAVASAMFGVDKRRFARMVDGVEEREVGGRSAVVPRQLSPPKAPVKALPSPRDSEDESHETTTNDDHEEYDEDEEEDGWKEYGSGTGDEEEEEDDYEEKREKRDEEARLKQEEEARLRLLPDMDLDSGLLDPDLDGNSTVPEDPQQVIVEEINYNLILWMPFVLIPSMILLARFIKYLYRLYQAKKYGYGDDLIDDPLSQLGLTQLGLKLNRGYDDLSDIRNIRKEQKRLERKIAMEDRKAAAALSRQASEFEEEDEEDVDGSFESAGDTIQRADRKLIKILDVVLAVIFLIDYSLSLYTAEDRLAFYFNVSSLIDLVSIVPPFVYFLVKEGTQFVWFLGLLRILRASRILRTYRLLSFSETEEKRELTIAALSFCNFIFLSASVINALETLNASKRVDATLTTWHDSLYYIMVTFSTIGFGDLTPSTVPSRVVVMFLIIIVIVYVPYQTSRIVDIFSSTSMYQRARHRGSDTRPHVILAGMGKGQVGHAVLIDFCREFMAASAASAGAGSASGAGVIGDGGGSSGGKVAGGVAAVAGRATAAAGAAMAAFGVGGGSTSVGGGSLSRSSASGAGSSAGGGVGGMAGVGVGVADDAVHVVVVLTPGTPCLETRKLLRHPFYRNKIVWLSGSAMSVADLKRADADRATALFVLGAARATVAGGGGGGGGGSTAAAGASTEADGQAEQSIPELEEGGEEEDSELRTARTADAAVLMQSLVAKKAHPGLMVISQVTDTRSAELAPKCGSDRVMCLETVKMGILARECLVPGFLAFVTNLVSTYRGGGAGYAVDYVEARLEAARRKRRALRNAVREERRKAKERRKKAEAAAASSPSASLSNVIMSPFRLTSPSSDPADPNIYGEDEDDTDSDADDEPPALKRTREYHVGAINQIYTLRVPSGLVGATFREATELVYATFAVTLIGIIPAAQRGVGGADVSGGVILNPGPKQVLKATDVLLCIVPSPQGDEVTLRISIQFRDGGVTRDQLRQMDDEHARAGAFLVAAAGGTKLEDVPGSVGASAEEVAVVGAGADGNPFADPTAAPSRKKPTVRDHVILCGRISSRALRHFVKSVRKAEEVAAVLKSTQNASAPTPILCLMDHVPDEAIAVSKARLASGGIAPVEGASQGIWQEILSDPLVSVMRGTPLKKTSLEKAGIGRCRRIVIFTGGSGDEEGPEGEPEGEFVSTDAAHMMPDANAIFIVKMIQEEFPSTPFLVELVSASNVRYFASSQATNPLLATAPLRAITSPEAAAAAVHLRMRSVMDNAGLGVADRVKLYQRVRMRGLKDGGAGEDGFFGRLWRFAMGEDLRRQEEAAKAAAEAEKEEKSRRKKRKDAKRGLGKEGTDGDKKPLLEVQKSVNFTVGEDEEGGGAGVRSEAKILVAAPPPIVVVEKPPKKQKKEKSKEEESDDSSPEGAAAPSGQSTSGTTSYLERMVAQAEAEEDGSSLDGGSGGHYDQFFAAGWVATQSLPYTLLAQCYYRPYILDVIKALAGSVGHVEVPRACRGKMYSVLMGWMLARGLLPVGLYRHGKVALERRRRRVARGSVTEKDEDDMEDGGEEGDDGTGTGRQAMPYVYTNCRGYDIVNADDLVFVIRPYQQ